MTLNIWRFTDGKPGHDSQSTGLCTAIKKLKPGKHFDIKIESTFRSLNNYLFKRFPDGKNLPKPDLIIGAGHRTHLPMISARRAFGGKIILLMKPSLPLSLFDFCIIPEHDGVPDKNNVINSIGAINPLEFNSEKTANSGLILIGGPSKHFNWDEGSVLKQIEHIITDNPATSWVIANSPRTPANLKSEFQNKLGKTLKFVDCAETSSDELRRLIYNSHFIWVTKDSVSMIYEALSSGATVGLIELQNIHASRISESIKKLINNNNLITYSDWKNNRELNPALSRFNEAERCAELLLKKGALN